MNLRITNKIYTCAFVALFILTNFQFAMAQEVKRFFYQGTVAGRSVWFYLKQLPNNCGGSDIYEAMYQYGKGKNWIELMNQTDEKGNFCFTEIRFTGVLILKKTVKGMSGIWISPDGKKLVFSSNRNNNGGNDTNVFIADWKD